jgi:hypothetical protein
METLHRLAKGVLVGVLCFAVTACSRSHYRTQADRDVIRAIGEKGGYLDGGNIYAGRASRLYDPYSADCPPMPPDDPRSNQLMHWVDGKRGYKHWDKFGRASSVESSDWLKSLPVDEDGTVRLDLRDSVRVARVNSRDYQRNLETLYVSALEVTFEQFQFDHQFFAGTRFDQEFFGSKRGAKSESRLDSLAGFSKLSATGGELVAGFANSLVWDSWSSGSDLFTSTIDFTLLQPLLRFGGRARVMELLTQSERDLLANVRQMEQFRQGFYINITTGRATGSGPSLADQVGQGGLGLIAGFPSGRSGTAEAGGYLGLLQDQQQIRNQATNITALRDSLAQLGAAFDANRINSRLQVDQARQALLNAQSSLLASRTAYDSRIDDFKIQLGIPPDLPIEVSDPLLDRFILIDPKLTQLRDGLNDILLEIRLGREQPSRELLDSSIERLSGLDALIDDEVEKALVDLARLDQRLPERIEQLRQVAEQVREMKADVDPRVYSEEITIERIDYIKRRLPSIASDLRKVFDQRKGVAAKVGQSDNHEAWKELNALSAQLSDLLLELSLVHAEIRLQGITLLPIEIEPREAYAFAQLNRLDWMNARANLVDKWRKIEFFANDLKSDLDLVVDGQLATRGDNVLNFDDDRSRVRLSVEYDSPTARVAERNRYREVLIRYQQARRDYMLFEDRVSQSLRNTLRIIKLSHINLEVRRAEVQVAIAQVDIARLSLNPPVRPNQLGQTSPTAARDLVSALSALLDAQNDMLNVWVSYEVLRELLDFEMGTMELDPTGIWIDPGPIEKSSPPVLPDGAESDSGEQMIDDSLVRSDSTTTHK